MKNLHSYAVVEPKRIIEVKAKLFAFIETTPKPNYNY